MHTPVVIPTEREGVVLRELTEADDEVYQASFDYSRPEISEFDDNGPTNYLTVDQVRESRERAKESGKLRLGIWDGDTFVGMVGRTPFGEGAEIGYWLDSRHTGKGYATIATRAVVQYDAGTFTTVFANVVEGNAASIRVLERSGFREVARKSGKIVLHHIKQPL